MGEVFFFFFSTYSVMSQRFTALPLKHLKPTRSFFLLQLSFGSRVWCLAAGWREVGEDLWLHRSFWRTLCGGAMVGLCCAADLVMADCRHVGFWLDFSSIITQLHCDWLQSVEC